MLYVEIAIVVGLIVVNGLLAMSELAVVSSRPARLRARAEAGSSGAQAALDLAANPGRFLSTVQIGITLVGVLSGAFSGATLGQRLSETLKIAGLRDSLADPIGVAIVVALITYGSLIVGELVPKQIALRDPEGVASRVARAMRILALVAAPLVWLLDISGRAMLSLLGQSESSNSVVTDEEIRTIIAEAEHHGTIEADEKKMIAGVMRLADRAVRSLMTPRTDVEWINIRDEPDALRARLLSASHSRLPVGDGTVDEMIGVIETREAIKLLLSPGSFDLRPMVLQTPVVHDNSDALDVLTVLKEASTPMALVHDEYGHFEGLVTPADVLETIAGEFRTDLDNDDPVAVERDDGSWLLAGYMPVDEMAERLGIRLTGRRDYETLAGFVLAHLHRLPETGESFIANGWKFEVVDLDGRRIDKVIAKKVTATRRIN